MKVRKLIDILQEMNGPESDVLDAELQYLDMTNDSISRVSLLKSEAQTSPLSNLYPNSVGSVVFKERDGGVTVRMLGPVAGWKGSVIE